MYNRSTDNLISFNPFMTYKVGYKSELILFLEHLRNGNEQEPKTAFIIK